MALQKLFLKEVVSDWRQVGNSMSTFYRFDGSALSIQWKGEVRTMKANIGDGIFVDCWGGFPRFGKIKLPKHRGEKILWLLGIPKPLRKSTEEEVEEATADYIEYCTEHEIDGWLYHIRNDGRYYIADAAPQFAPPECVAGWVSDSITDEDVRELFQKRQPVYPDWWVEKVLEQG